MEEKDKQKFLFDIEADNLLDDITKIHCLAYCDTKTGLICSTSFQDQIRDFFLQKDVVFIGHNIVGYDIPAVEKIFGIKVEAPQWDTLGISWVLSPDRKSHSLESYGKDYNIDKIQIEDWNNLDTKSYILRCETDVKINYELWKTQASYLNRLYEGQHGEICRFLNYIHQKLDAVKDHQELGVELDIELCNKSLQELEAIKEEKLRILSQSMPKKPNKATKFPPKIMYKKDGTPSENRIKWLKFLEEQGKPQDWNQEVEYISSYEDCNVGSSTQVKNWLFSLQWEPANHKYERVEGQREMRKIPQIREKNNEDGDLCPSVLKLAEKEPAIKELESLSIINNRINIFKGFLKDQKNGRLYQGIHKFTNTMRMTHSGIVNLAKPHRKYAENVRRCLIAGEGQVIVGCDLKGIEDVTKRHYIYPHDKDYVIEVSTPGFDAHLDIAILAGMITKEQADNHKNKVEDFGEIRSKAKNVNFSATYGASAETINLKYGLPLKEAKKLLEIYWKRNWAIKKIAEQCKVKTVGNQKWLYNEVSGFWYSLRAEKDRFSTLNQGTAAYCFDRLVYHTRKQGLKINWEMHDEENLVIYEECLESVKNKIGIAVQQVNEELKLNLPIEVSLEIGKNYADAH